MDQVREQEDEREQEQAVEQFASSSRPPLSMFALLRTISEIIGNAPTAEARVFATPMARRSRSKSVFRRHGSNNSIALGAEQRLQAPDQAEQDDVLDPGRGRDAAEVREGERRRGVLDHLRHVHQEPRADLVLGRWSGSKKLSGNRYVCRCSRSNASPSPTATTSTTSWAGTLRTRSAGTSGRPNRMSRRPPR